MATKHKKMNAAFKKIWVNALRSGDYKQGEGELRYECTEDFWDKKDNHTEKGVVYHCCLGVAYECINGRKPNKNAEVLGKDMLKKMGLTDDTQQTLAGWNDSGRWGFKKIATWIEKNL